MLACVTKFSNDLCPSELSWSVKILIPKLTPIYWMNSGKSYILWIMQKKLLKGVQ